MASICSGVPRGLEVCLQPTPPRWDDLEEPIRWSLVHDRGGSLFITNLRNVLLVLQILLLLKPTDLFSPWIVAQKSFTKYRLRFLTMLNGRTSLLLNCMHWQPPHPLCHFNHCEKTMKPFPVCIRKWRLVIRLVKWCNSSYVRPDLNPWKDHSIDFERENSVQASSFS